jgi:hypothetical protein
MILTSRPECQRNAPSPLICTVANLVLTCAHTDVPMSTAKRIPVDTVTNQSQNHAWRRTWGMHGCLFAFFLVASSNPKLLFDGNRAAIDDLYHAILEESMGRTLKRLTTMAASSHRKHLRYSPQTPSKVHLSCNTCGLFLVSCTAFYGTLWLICIRVDKALSYNSRSAWWALGQDGDLGSTENGTTLAGDTVCAKANAVMDPG